MTPEMIDLARRNAAKRLSEGAPDNVEFHLSTIDRLPLSDLSVDCVISNCVINLAPDKTAIFREIARVLRPGGRVAISDIALKKSLPSEIGNDLLAYVGCIAGAISIDDYRAGLIAAGFSQVEIIDSGSDLNAYANIEKESGCCVPTAQPTTARALPVTASGCCSSSEPHVESDIHITLTELLSRYNVNDYAASVRVFAIK
jgi:arsenite methyltransferase